MKNYLLGAFVFVTLSAVATATVPVSAQATQEISSITVSVGDPQPSFKRKLARVLSFGIVAAAPQATADSIRRDTPFDVAADHDGVDTDAYEIRVNTALMGTLPVTALTNGTVMFPFNQGLPRGTYTITVTAVGPGGTGVSDPLSLSVTAGNPSNPRNIRKVDRPSGEE